MKSVLGYCVPWSVAPGECVEVKVSVLHAARYESRVLRVICANPVPGGAGSDLRPVDHPSNGSHAGRVQRNPVGSYLEIPASDAFGSLSALTVALYVRPTLLNGQRQCLVSQQGEFSASGFTLEILESGHLSFSLGDGTNQSRVTCPKPLLKNRWFLVWGRFSSQSGEVNVGQSSLAAGFEADQSCEATQQTKVNRTARNKLSLLIAAHGDPAVGKWHKDHFTGQIERPILSSVWLAQADLSRGLCSEYSPQSRDSIIALWDFALDMQSDNVRDISAHAHHGRLVNLPSRAVKGHNWRGDSQSWKQSPEQYAAIHFHDDDLYDAAWQTDFTITIPEHFPSGFYAVRLSTEDDESFIPFFVRPEAEISCERLAFLAPTATYIAYANYRFPFDVDYNEALLGRLLTVSRETLHIQVSPEVGLSTYDTHADGSGVRFSSRLRPMLNTGPGSDLWNYGADTHILQWLDRIGQTVDVITDEDLHAQGAELLSTYQCVITGTHPEYWTAPMWAGLRTWLDNGGRLMYLGGNGFYWQTAMHPDRPGAIEVRRAEGGSRYWAEEPGEYHMAWTGEFGGLTRRTGNPPHALVGVGTRAIGFQTPGWYERTPQSHDDRVAFIFDGIGADERIGDFGTLGAAAGSELDATDDKLGTPRHALVLAVSTGHGSDLMAVTEDILMPNPGISADFNESLHAEMVFFETHAGGAVFSVGSIQWAASLAHSGFDNNIARISTNVLRRFLSSEAFVAPTNQGTNS